MALRTLHQATCDRCGRVETTDTEGEIPATWRTMAVGGDAAKLLCDTPCLIQLSLWITGANIRKPNRKKTELAAVNA